MDYIEIRKLEVFAKHGVLPEENILGQKFIISVKLYMDTSPAGESDDLSDSVNYAKVAAMIEKEASKHTFKLIETFAEMLGKKILLSFSAVKEVDVEIEKPWAPIGLPLDTVLVHIHRKWHDVYLSVGSNLGQKQQNIEKAIAMLSEESCTNVIRISKLIQTKPVGYTEQDDFLNGAIYIKTLRTPESLLLRISEIEKALKRERKIHWGPRTIDLDILLYDDLVIQTENLIIPHIEMTNRLFVLEPLNEIAPHLVHPVEQKSIRTLLERCQQADEQNEY